MSTRILAATTRFLNLVTVPFGALPTCHGAGGAAAHHRFGARGAGAPLTLTAVCLTGAGNILTSMITTDATKDLGIAVGNEVFVVIKASEVMLTTE